MIGIKYGKKFCTKCRTLKPLSDFYLNEACRFGVHNICKACVSRFSKEYYEKNRLALIEKMTVRHIQKRKKVMDLLGGQKCVHCGNTQYESLQINHKHGGGYQEYKDGCGGTTFIHRIASGKRRIDDLEVVCAVCNTWHYLVTILGLEDGYTITWRKP